MAGGLHGMDRLFDTFRDRNASFDWDRTVLEFRALACIVGWGSYL